MSMWIGCGKATASMTGSGVCRTNARNRDKRNADLLRFGLHGCSRGSGALNHERNSVDSPVIIQWGRVPVLRIKTVTGPDKTRCLSRFCPCDGKADRVCSLHAIVQEAINGDG